MCSKYNGYKLLKNWVTICENNKSVPAVIFVKSTSDGKEIVCGGTQLFNNLDWKVGMCANTSTLVLPVESVVNCFNPNRDRINKDLNRLSTLEKKIQSVLGNVPIADEIEVLIKSIREGINKYEYITINKKEYQVK